MKDKFMGKNLKIFLTIAIFLLILGAAGVGSARAQNSYHDIGKLFLQTNPQDGGTISIGGEPLRIEVNQDTSVQVFHQKYSDGATFGNAGSGFFIGVEGTVFGPFYNSYTPLRHEGPSGNGMPGSPFQVFTEGLVNGTNYQLRVLQTVTYINNENHFQLTWEITNSATTTTCFKAYHAADLYFADNDYGIGYYDSQSGAVGGFNEARNWFMVFIPNPRATHYEEAFYSTIWDRVQTVSDLQDSIDQNYIDNGAAIQWDACLQGGESVTFGDVWSFGESEAAVIQSGSTSEAFRQPDLLTPVITTYIPSPLDISTDPKVIGTNFLLAAIAMMLFAAASEILNRTLANNEEYMQRLLVPLKRIRDSMGRINISRRLGSPLWFEVFKLIIVLLIYGFVFSLLDRSWKPFSITGIYLFLTMVIAYGLVGMADDITQWLAARLWKMPARVNVRTGNLLLIVSSTAISRIFGILPGIMFGMPEAIEVDEVVLRDQRKANKLLRLTAAVLILILLVSWLPTIATTMIQRGNLPDIIVIMAGGVESMLLLIFAVTVQNIFLHMLALPDTFGRALARWSKPAWAIVFLLSTFLFLHTLLNPRGELAAAVSSTNIILFLTTIFLFLVFAGFVWLFFLIVNSMKQGPMTQSAGFQGSPPVVKKSSAWIWVLLVCLVVICLCLGGIAVIAILFL